MKPRTKVFIGVLGLLFLGAAGVAWQKGAFARLTDKSHGAIDACEEQISDQLISPASYKRVWADYTPRSALTSAEYRELDRRRANIDSYSQRLVDAYTDELDRSIKRKAKRGGLTDVEQMVVDGRRQTDARAARNDPADRTGFVTLQYDSDNRFGATLRSFAICRFGAIGEDFRFERKDILQSGPMDDELGQLSKKLAESAIEK